MPLVQNPTPCTLRDIYVEEGRDPATGIGIIAGVTKPPADFITPTWVITEKRSEMAHGAAVRQAYLGKLGMMPPGAQPPGPTTEQYVAQLAVTRRGSQGTNKSIYISKGVYETNYTFDMKDYTAAKKDPLMANALQNMANWLSPWKKATQPRVYFVMPDSVADLNRQAEAEHCADFILAYQLSIHAVETALDQVALMPTVTAASALAARTARVQLLQNALPAGLKDLAQSPDQCGTKFLDLCHKSKIRDSSNWHTWGLDYLGPGVQAASIHYLTGKQREESGRIFLQYTKGQSEVGTHTSASIIHF